MYLEKSNSRRHEMENERSVARSSVLFLFLKVTADFSFLKFLLEFVFMNVKNISK